MGFKLRVTGQNDEIKLGVTDLVSVGYSSVNPKIKDADGAGKTIRITGKIIPGTKSENTENVKKISQWTLIPNNKADFFRDLEVEYVAAGEVLRNIKFTNAYILKYSEEFIDDPSGNGESADEGSTGRFELVVTQKSERNDEIEVEGNYPGEEA